MHILPSLNYNFVVTKVGKKYLYKPQFRFTVCYALQIQKQETILYGTTTPKGKTLGSNPPPSGHVTLRHLPTRHLLPGHLPPGHIPPRTYIYPWGDIHLGQIPPEQIPPEQIGQASTRYVQNINFSGAETLSST